jgi:hypothetical protein
MRITWYVTALLLFGATVFARTGETEAQIEKRYGRPTSGSRWTKTYSNKNLFIIVTFDNGVSGIETFQKRNDSPMARAEIEKLLEANSDGSKWQRSARNDFEISYTAKTRFAEYNAITNTLTIADDAAVHRINARNRSLGAKP